MHPLAKAPQQPSIKQLNLASEIMQLLVGMPMDIGLI
jgi:hypothetical protein